MAYLLKQGGRIDYNYKEYYLDTEEELRDIKAGLASLERIQAKYEDKEEDETVGLSI